MPEALIQVLDDSVQFPANFPMRLRDQMDADGVILIHDYAKKDCLPLPPVPQGQANPTFAYNLARKPGAWPNRVAGSDGQFIGAAGLITYPNSKGLGFVRNAGNSQTNYELLTGTGNFAATIATNNWLFIAWVRQGVAMQNMHIIGSGNTQDSDAANAGQASFSMLLTEKNQPGGLISLARCGSAVRTAPSSRVGLMRWAKASLWAS